MIRRAGVSVRAVETDSASSLDLRRWMSPSLRPLMSLISADEILFLVLAATYGRVLVARGMPSAGPGWVGCTVIISP